MRYIFKVYLICDNKRIGYGCGFVYVWVKVPLRLQGRASEHHWSYRQLWATWLGDWEQNIAKTACLLTTEQSLQPCFCLFNCTKHIGWKKKIHQTDNWLSGNEKWSLFLIFMHYDGVSVRLQNLLFNRNFVRQGTENYGWLKHSTLWTKNK